MTWNQAEPYPAARLTNQPKYAKPYPAAMLTNRLPKQTTPKLGVNFRPLAGAAIGVSWGFALLWPKLSPPRLCLLGLSWGLILLGLLFRPPRT